MKPIWKLLALGVTVIFLIQSGITVRSPRYHRHHRHYLAIVRPITDMTLFNLPPVECPVVSELAVYGNKE